MEVKRLLAPYGKRSAAPDRDAVGLTFRFHTFMMTVKKERFMKLSAPMFSTWLIAVIIGGIGILQHFRVLHIAALAPYSIHLIVAGFALLVLATLLRKL